MDEKTKALERLVTLDDFGQGSFIHSFASVAGVEAALTLARLGNGQRHYIPTHNSILKKAISTTQTLISDLGQKNA